LISQLVHRVPNLNMPMHCFMLCSGSIDYATPQDQQFAVDYDLSMQNDQRSRSPAASPVRHVMKRPRHAAGEQQAGTPGTPLRWQQKYLIRLTRACMTAHC
jgi:hypothetical protein